MRQLNNKQIMSSRDTAAERSVGHVRLAVVACIHRVQKKVVYFVFEHNFTTTGSIFLQFSMTITK